MWAFETWKSTTHVTPAPTRPQLLAMPKQFTGNQHCLILPTVIRMLTCSLCNYPRGLWCILLVWLLISELCSDFLAFEAVFLSGFCWLIWFHHYVIVVSDCGLSACASLVDLIVLVFVPLHVGKNLLWTWFAAFCTVLLYFVQTLPFSPSESFVFCLLSL